MAIKILAIVRDSASTPKRMVGILTHGESMIQARSPPQILEATLGEVVWSAVYGPQTTSMFVIVMISSITTVTGVEADDGGVDFDMMDCVRSRYRRRHDDGRSFLGRSSGCVVGRRSEEATVLPSYGPGRC
jgi:hypothetical protein